MSEQLIPIKTGIETFHYWYCIPRRVIWWLVNIQTFIWPFSLDWDWVIDRDPSSKSQQKKIKNILTRVYQHYNEKLQHFNIFRNERSSRFSPKSLFCLILGWYWILNCWRHLSLNKVWSIIVIVNQFSNKLTDTTTIWMYCSIVKLLFLLAVNVWIKMLKKIVILFTIAFNCSLFKHQPSRKFEEQGNFLITIRCCYSLASKY